MKKFSSKSVKATKSPQKKAASHGQTKPRLKTRHLSTIGKSAFGAVPTGGAPAFPPAGGAPAAMPMDSGGAALAGPSGGPPGM